MRLCDLRRDLAGQRVTKDRQARWQQVWPRGDRGTVASRCAFPTATSPLSGHAWVEGSGSPTSQRKQYGRLLKVTSMCVHLSDSEVWTADDGNAEISTQKSLRKKINPS